MLRLLTYNIRFGGTGREAALAETIHAAAADVVVLQEATRPDVVGDLAERTGMKLWAASPLHSVGFMSRIEVDHTWLRPPPWIHVSRAPLELLVPGRMRVLGAHLSAVHSNWTERTRVREIKALLGAIAKRDGGFPVLAGDFNTLAPGEVFDLGRLPMRLQLLAMMSGRTIRWRTIQIMLDAGFVDAFRAFHADDTGHTFPTWDPHVRLDYVFVPRGETSRLKSCEIFRGGAAATASDHFPLLAEFEV